MTSTPPKPDNPSLSNKRQALGAAICRDCYDGPLRIRDRGETYLPRFPRESPEAYKDRLSTSVFFDVFSRTVEGLTGLVMRTPPQLADDLPQPIKDMWENIDRLGSRGDVFCADRHSDGTTDGHFIIFVDMPRKSSVEKVRADQSGKLPYWVGIKKQDVLAAQYREIEGEYLLSHFRYQTTVVKPVGRYDEAEILTVREYNLVVDESGSRAVQFEVHERDPKLDTWLTVDSGQMEIDEIPIAVGYHGKKLGPFESRPPLLPLALENIKHYQLVSDNDNVLHLCSVPQFAVIGSEDESTSATVSPNAGWSLPAGGDIKYAEPAGAGLAAAADRIEKSERRMAILGLSQLMSDRRGAETATSKRIDKSESDSALSRQAAASEDAFEEAIRLSAKWLDLQLPEKRDGRWLSLSKDFEHLPMDPEVMKAYVSAVAQAGLPIRVLLEAWQKEFRIPDTVDLDEIEQEMLANAAAKEIDRDNGIKDERLLLAP